jgi:23S rRNA (cytidine1920-2'-O)/16S rRNA (cytidine1409-2'-O)-methyltransferase
VCCDALLQVHAEVIQRISAGIQAYGFQCLGITESPLKGDKSGNTEFLAHFQHDPSRGPISVPPEGTRDEGGDAGRAAQQAAPAAVDAKS